MSIIQNNKIHFYVNAKIILLVYLLKNNLHPYSVVNAMLFVFVKATDGTGSKRAILSHLFFFR
jgi:hypothetical protein